MAQIPPASTSLILNQQLDLYKFSFNSEDSVILYKNGFKKREKKSRTEHLRNSGKKSKSSTRRTSRQFSYWTDNDPIEKFDLKIFDQILDICPLGCTDSVAN